MISNAPTNINQIIVRMMSRLIQLSFVNAKKNETVFATEKRNFDIIGINIWFIVIYVTWLSSNIYFGMIKLMNTSSDLQYAYAYGWVKH